MWAALQWLYDIAQRPNLITVPVLCSSSKNRKQRPGAVLPDRWSVYVAPGTSRSRHASQSDDWRPASAEASAWLQSVRRGGAGGGGGGDGDGGGDGGSGGGGDGGVGGVGGA